MKFEIIPKQDNIPPFDKDTLAVKYIEYYPFGDIYKEDEITEFIISKILNEIPTGFGGYLYLNPDGEADWMEVVSDGEWLYLGCYFEDDETGDSECYYCYNPKFANSVDLLENGNFSDKSLYTDIYSGGQSPIPKFQAINDFDAGIKAVEYFIHTGKIYPGIDWIKD